MSRGELSFSAVRALTRVATTENESELLALALGSTTAQIERMVRGFKRGARCDEAELDRERHESRMLSIRPDLDGMYEIRGKLEPEVGALLMRAIEAASDTLFRKHPKPPGQSDDTRRRAAAQRRADAIGVLAERAMAAGVAEADAPVSGTRAERYQVVLHVDAATLSADTEKPGRSELDDGTRVSAETSRRISCDAGLVRLSTDGSGRILGVGRRKRTISRALRRALEARDRGCRFPGCGSRYTDAHHVRHWADGGETSLANCLLLCAHHHRLAHEGGWRIEWWGEGRPAFIDPRGSTHFEGRWEPPQLPDRPVETLMDANRRAGARPDGWTAGARWKREADVPDRVYFSAMAAVG